MTPVKEWFSDLRKRLPFYGYIPRRSDSGKGFEVWPLSFHWWTILFCVIIIRPPRVQLLAGFVFLQGLLSVSCTLIIYMEGVMSCQMIILYWAITSPYGTLYASSYTSLYCTLGFLALGLLCQEWCSNIFSYCSAITGLQECYWNYKAILWEEYHKYLQYYTI